MPLDYIRHEKLDLRRSPEFNEAWLRERIGEDPSILGLGDVRVLDHERSLPGGGRLDMLLFDEDNSYPSRGTIALVSAELRSVLPYSPDKPEER